MNVHAEEISKNKENNEGTSEAEAATVFSLGGGVWGGKGWS